MFTTSLEQSGINGMVSEHTGKDAVRSVASGEATIQGIMDNKREGKQPAMRLRSLGGRHVLVKDTAYQT